MIREMTKPELERYYEYRIRLRHNGSLRDWMNLLSGYQGGLFVVSADNYELHQDGWHLAEGFVKRLMNGEFDCRK